MSKHPLIEAITNRPLLVARGQEELFKASLEFIVGHERANDILAGRVVTTTDDFWGEDDDWFRPYIVENGILQVPVMGVLLNRFPYQLGRWATGYDYIEQAIIRGMRDGNVLGIALVIDSPGGEVAGCFELVDKIYDWRSEKPIMAFAADHSYSAAFAIASAAGRIAVTRSGGTGSVGVVTAHVDYSGMLDKAGIKIKFIFAGKHKVDGNPYESLPNDVEARIQARIDKIYDTFIETVARNRDMDQDAVRETEALTYDAEGSIEIGFADQIGALEDEMISFQQEVADPEGDQMTTKTNTKTGAQAAEPDGGIDQATHDAAVAEARAEGKTEGKTEGLAEGAKAERDRINAILGSDEGKARPKAALSAALNTDMTADQATSFLASLDDEKAETPKAEGGNPKGGNKSFTEEMAKDTPGVGADEGLGDEDPDDPAAKANSILSAYGAASGRKRKTA